MPSPKRRWPVLVDHRPHLREVRQALLQANEEECYCLVC
jgi:hypothetical protein